MRYTSLLRPMFLQPSRRRCIVLAIFLCIAVCANSQTDTDDDQASIWSRPAHDLVQKALESAGTPSTVSVEVENRSGIAPGDLQQIRKAFDDELRKGKVKVVRMDAAMAEMKFILSRNARGLLWIARVKQGTTEQVSMLEFPEPMTTNAPSRATLFQLQRTLLLVRVGQILDVAPADNYILVLGSEQISVYPRDDPDARATSSVFIPHSSSWPRDLRGRIFLSGDSFTAYLPGVRCTGTAAPNLSGQCVETDDPWPLLNGGENVPAAFFTSARNHFSGVLGGSMAGASVSPFYTAARLGESDAAMWAFAGTDGQTRLYIRIAGAQQPVRTVSSLGSDLAAVASNCGSRRQLLVTGDGDESAPDILQAFEIQNREATAASERISFDGPITALWATSDPSRVMAIVRNLGKERYEAYSISITCSR